jgi:hypothetical protein
MFTIPDTRIPSSAGGIAAAPKRSTPQHDDRSLSGCREFYATTAVGPEPDEDDLSFSSGFMTEVLADEAGRSQEDSDLESHERRLPIVGLGSAIFSGLPGTNRQVCCRVASRMALSANSRFIVEPDEARGSLRSAEFGVATATVTSQRIWITDRPGP